MLEIGRKLGNDEYVLVATVVTRTFRRWQDSEPAAKFDCRSDASWSEVPFPRQPRADDMFEV
jgi:hypothetical protein